MSGEGELAGLGWMIGGGGREGVARGGGGVRRRRRTRGAHKTAVTELDFRAS